MIHRSRPGWNLLSHWHNCCLLVLLASASSGTAAAQDASSEAASAVGKPAGEISDDEIASEATFEDEIVITAQKREQSLQDVPVAVTLIPAEEINDLRLQRVLDIVAYVPNTDVKDALPGFSQVITIRGVGQNDFGFLNTSSVGVYVDEVHLASPGQFGFMAFDLERVEVLRGPQGTLYGRNTTGGAVNFHSVRPSPVSDGYLRLGAGSYETTELEGAIGGPLGGDWSGRLSGRIERQGESFHFNRLTGEDFGSTATGALRGQLRFSKERLDVNLSLSYASSDGAHVPYEQRGLLDRGAVEAILDDPELGHPIYAALGAPRCSATAAGGFDGAHCVNVHGYSDTDDDPRSHDAHTTSGYLDVEQYGATLAIDYGLGATTTLTSITGYQHFDNRRTEDQSGPLILFAPRIHGWIDQFSQELRLVGTAGDVDWIAGAFYSADSAHERATDAMDDFFATRLHSLDDQETSSFALFSHADWALSDRWAVNAGARLTWETREKVAASTDLNPFRSSLFLSLFQGIDPTTSGAVTYASSDDELNYRFLSGKLGVDFRVSEEWLLYLSITQGLKSGGWITGIVFEDYELEPFEPEELLAYEVGFKGRLGEGVLLNGAAFYYDYQSIQTYVQSTIGFRLANIDGASNLGAELELMARPLPNLDVRAGIGWLETEMSAFMGADGMVPEGNELPNSPEWDLNGLLRYELTLTDRLELALQTDFKYQSDMYRTADNDPLTRAESCFLINGRIAVMPADGAWELALWGKNLGSQDVVESGFNVPILGLVTQTYNPPRTFGISWRWNL